MSAATTKKVTTSDVSLQVGEVQGLIKTQGLQIEQLLGELGSVRGEVVSLKGEVGNLRNSFLEKGGGREWLLRGREQEGER